MRFVPSVMVRPSGVASPGAVYGYPEIAQHPADVATYQRILMGLGFDVGPQRADGRLGPATAHAVGRFQGWYNSEPAAGRGPALVVDELLGPDTQRALNRYADRQATATVAQVPVQVDAPAATSPSVAGATPIGATWGQRGFLDPTITLGTANTAQTTSPWTVLAGVTAVVGVSIAALSYLEHRKTRR